MPETQAAGLSSPNAVSFLTAAYKPELLGRQSFLYNEDKKWIPVL